MKESIIIFPKISPVVYIEQTKSEICALRPKEYGTNKIPEASNELDAIVKATEVAAETVMDSADEIGELAEKCDDETNAKLVEKAVRIIRELDADVVEPQRAAQMLGIA